MSDLLGGLRSRSRRRRIGLVNSPNMAILGRRRRAVYGDVRSIGALEERVARLAEALGLDLAAPICSSHAGEIVD